VTDESNGNASATETVETPDPPVARRFGPPRAEFAAFIELFVLSGLLVAQPLFDFLGRNARQLVLIRLKLSDVLVFVFLVLVLIPFALWVLEILAGLVFLPARRVVHMTLISVLLGVIAGNYLKVTTRFGAAPRVLLTVAVAVFVAWVMTKTRVIMQWLHYLAIAPLIFALLFAFASPASTLYLTKSKVAKVTVERPARVVLIVFDELPVISLLDGTGHVDTELFPNFAALAGDATWYRNDTTVAGYTDRAVPAILTGRMPATEPRLPIAKDYPQNLFTLLGGTYDMHAREFVEQLCPLSQCEEPRYGNPTANLVRETSRVMRNLMDLDRSSWDRKLGFRFGLDGLVGNEGTFTPIDSFLGSLEPSTEPRLDYFHTALPHAPWRYQQDGRTRTLEALRPGFLATGEPTRRSLGRLAHLLQVQTADWVLGEVMQRLKAIGEYDQTLFVVTSDHGVDFPWVRYITPQNFMHIMWTPLFVKAPGQAAGRVDDRPMLSLDVLPTIADILGVRIPWHIDGIPASAKPRPAGARPFAIAEIGKVAQIKSFGTADTFAQVLRFRAAPPGGDPALRLYRAGPYGSLIGRRAAPLVSHSASPLEGTLVTTGDWDNVDPAARSIPWAGAHGTVTGAATGQAVAIAVNGRVAGLAVAQETGEYYAVLAPGFFRKGRNDVVSYVIEGRPRAPKLSPVTTPKS
jgi:hypothetical protein